MEPKNNSCLFIKPKVSNSENINKLRNELPTVERAIHDSGLQLTEKYPQGLVADDDITSDKIRTVYESGYYCIDVNLYKNETFFPLSPYLCYYMSICHSIGNRTILFCNSGDHLNYNMRRHHTIVYTDRLELVEKFQEIIQSIHNDNQIPDNPVQEYLKEHATKLEMQELKEKLKQRETIEKAQQNKILFRRVA
jgi:hypothetical protein